MMTFGVFGNGMLKNNALLTQFLQSYLGQPAQVKRIYPLISSTKTIDTMLGWGRKKSYRRANRFAKQHGLNMLTLEDGFLRSLDSGKHSRHACSMIIDPIGIYFDAREPSLLEQLISQQLLSQEDTNEVKRIIASILEERLSKYNGTAKTGTLSELHIDAHKTNILLIDQVAGDQSIVGAGASKKSFAKMLKTAKKHHPNATFWIKAHPAGKVGYLTQLSLPKDVQVISHAVNPIELLQVMDEVYTVSSHMGFEALLVGKKVHCFGVPWYAGWGLTNDEHCPKKLYKQAYQRRGQIKSASLIDLFSACYLKYSHYTNPATGQICQINEVIDWLVTNREWRDKLPNDLTIYEISRWKYGFVKAFLETSQTNLVFKPKVSLNPLLKPSQILIEKAIPKDQPYLVWGLAKKRSLANNYSADLPNIWCMEDGFVRSNGLGASLIEPLSVVIDEAGIYYNATEPSDLEQLLVAQPSLTPLQEARTVALIERLLKQQVSKYNVGVHQPLIIETSATNANREKILVVGQVEDDMSVQLCASDIKTNLQLLKTVRENNPNAYIIYKPHPDVQAGLRAGKIAEQVIQQYANQMVLDISMPECLRAVDSVHTISSLTGFEALLRQLPVTCYGLPFYAGWGLTTDKARNAIAQQAKLRRLRQQPLTLSQLVYNTLIRYPMYHLPNQHGLAQVEQVIEFLYSDVVSHEGCKVNSKKQRITSQAKQQFMKVRHQVFQSLLQSDKRQNSNK